MKNVALAFLCSLVFAMTIGPSALSASRGGFSPSRSNSGMRFTPTARGFPRAPSLSPSYSSRSYSPKPVPNTPPPQVTEVHHYHQTAPQVIHQGPGIMDYMMLHALMQPAPQVIVAAQPGTVAQASAPIQGQALATQAVAAAPTETRWGFFTWVMVLMITAFVVIGLVYLYDRSEYA